MNSILVLLMAISDLINFDACKCFALRRQMFLNQEFFVYLTLSFPGSPAGLPGPHTKSSRRSSCYNREVGVWVRLKAISVVLSLILASLGRFPRNFLPFSDSYTFLVYHQDI